MIDQRDVSDLSENIRRGMIPAHIYNDKELFALEKERLFSRAWIFVAHESEIPQDGDYVVRRVLEDSFIIARDSGGQIRAMFNMCLHRGMQVCRAELGNASNFRCPVGNCTPDVAIAGDSPLQVLSCSVELPYQPVLGVIPAAKDVTLRSAHMMLIEQRP